MEHIALIDNGTFLYWSALIVGTGVLTAICGFFALYLSKGGTATAALAAVPLCVSVSLVLGRLIHWYCRTDSYESFQVAMTDYTKGGYALMGAFAGCLIVAGVLRLTKLEKNLPRMLDCMALSGGAGIAVGRMAALFNTADRGVPVRDGLGLPLAYPVVNGVSGVAENRLATFMIQGMAVGLIVVILLGWLAVRCLKKRRIPDGDLCLVFLACYGASQIVLDSTRYDSLFLRSNGFISVVQILGAVALVGAVVVFSARMVKARGMKVWFAGLWLLLLGTLGGAGYMEYHVQRHGDQALFAYSVMSACLLAALVLMAVIRTLAEKKKA